MGAIFLIFFGYKMMFFKTNEKNIYENWEKKEKARPKDDSTSALSSGEL